MTEVTPSKLEELSPGTRDWLADLRPDELKTLQAVVEMPADEVREAFKMVQDLRTVGRFTKWVTITFVGLFLATVVLYENIIKVIGYRACPPPGQKPKSITHASGAFCQLALRSGNEKF